MRFAAIIVVALAFALVPYGRGVTGSAAAAGSAFTVNPGVDTIINDPGPLSQIIVGVDTTIQVIDAPASSRGEVFPPGSNTCTPPVPADSGLWVSIGTGSGSSRTLYGPNMQNNVHACGTATGSLQPDVFYTPVSQTSSGTGSSSSPFTVVTTVRLTSTLTLTQTITYVTGDAFFKQVVTLKNTGAAVSADIFHGADIFLAGSDAGYGYFDPSSGAVGGENGVDKTTHQNVDCRDDSNAVPGPFFEFFFPITKYQHYVETFFNTLWQDINATKTGAHLPDTIFKPCTDNAMGVEWDNVTASSTAPGTVADFFAFGKPQPPGKPSQPQAGLVGGGAACTVPGSGTTTCTGGPPSSSQSFKIDARCQITGPAPDKNSPMPTACSGGGGGSLGNTNVTITSISTGGGMFPSGTCTTTSCPDGGTVTFSGTASYANQTVPFSFSGSDDDPSGSDTFTVSITPVGGATQTYTWNCVGCLEITVQPLPQSTS